MHIITEKEMLFMNRTYKVIWSKARHCYVVVSELTKSQHKSSSKSELISTNIHQKRYFGKAAVAAIVAGLLTFGGVAYSPVLAADNTAGSGAGVAIGTGSNAPKNENVAIGKGATIEYSNGASKSTGDVAVGSGAVINNYASQGGSIAIGKNATVENMTGKQESLFALGQTQYHSGNAWGTVQIPDKPENVAGSIAIGDHTYARTGSIMIGSHNYRGLIGDQNVDTSKTKDYGININATTLGTNSFNQGAFSSVTGAYSIISGKYNGSGFSSYGVQNFGATITGSLNSIESATSSSEYSGIANSIVGTANRASNSNGSLIFGAGNEITNSVTTISAPSDGGDSAQALQKTLMQKVKDSNGGGATLAIGGGNKIDHAVRSQAIGVNNTLTGNLYHEDGLSFLDIPDVNEYSAQYNMVDGYNNNVANVNHAYVIGANNNIQGKTFSDATKDGVLSEKDREKAKKDDNLIVIGDNHTLANDVSNNIILGTADKTLTTSVSNVVMIGHNADVQKNGGVAIGAGSVAVIDKDAGGYDPANGDHQTDTTGTWKSTAAAVSVGDASKNITRQITNVAAGTQDTDAVNVAQLKAVSSSINTDIAASKTHFYSVKSTDAKAKNYNNDGATAANALAAGVGANADKASAVAIGDTAYAGSANGVAIGTGSWIRSSDGKPNANGGDVAIGQDSHVDSYVNQGGSIALGQNARVENMYGNTEKSWAFSQTEFDDKNIPLNPGNEAGGVAIGRNSFARTGSLMVGSHMYKGAIADIDEVDGTDSQKLRDNFNNINMTTLGTNSFNNGTFATVTGAYSATTAKKKIQNFAATVDGSLNSIESYKDAADNSGVASSIVGTANRIANSNNTTIIGAGNEVTNSLTDIKAPTEGGASAKALQDTLKDTLQNDAKGAVVVSGIGNKVDSASSISLSGSRNTVKNTKNAQLFGDNREVTNSNGVIIIGSADKTLKTTNVQNSTIIGHNANAQNDALAVGESASAGNNSIAIGMHASAGYSQNMALGYYANVANEVTNSTALGYGSQVTKRDILKSDDNEGVISVGKSMGQSGEKGMTRRIINVKAGVKATDAANVSQLTELKEGEHISITDSATPNEKGQTVKTISVKVDGQIEKGNTGILSGDTVYKEVHVDKDGNYIKSGYTVAENLNALDGKVKTNADNIEKNGQAIEKNSARIDTNSKNIEKNSQAIEKNSARIDTNAKNIEKNGQAIEKNSARIDTNAKNIEKNSQAIEKNAARIDTNSKNIEKNSQAIEKNSARIDTNAKNIEKNGQAIEKNSARIDTNAKNIEKNGQAIEKNSARIDTNAKNIEKNGQAIEKNSARIDTNSKNIEKNGKNIEILQETKADTNLSNITDAGKTVINNLAKKAVKVKAGSKNMNVTPSDVENGPITYTVDIAQDLNVNSITSKTITSDSITATTVTSDTVKTKNLSVSDVASIGDVTINKDGQGTVNGLKNKTWDPTKITSGQAATEDQLQAATKNAVNYDGDDSKTVTLRKDTTIQNVANTTIEEGSKNAVNAGTVYKETRVGKDGIFIRQANTAGQNITALDHQVAANTESIYNINNRVSNLDNRVNKVGAGAAALAALHPLDFDPDDKWDFAVGYGNYRNANSVAFGAFYRPNEDTMFSLGTNFGNGENMFNAGLSFKIGQGGSGITTSKTAMAKKIESLENTVDQQDKKIAELEALVKEQGEMIRQYVGKK